MSGCIFRRSRCGGSAICSRSVFKKNAITVLVNTLGEITGNKPGIISESNLSGECGIIIGNCDIPKYKEAVSDVRYNDYKIIYDGRDFIIAALNKTKRTAAVNKFIELIPTITSDLQEGVIFESRGKYAADKIVLNGTDIREYTIVYSEEMKFSSSVNDSFGYYASELRDVLINPTVDSGAVNTFDYYLVGYCGYRLKIINKVEYKRHTENYPHVILWGDCGVLPLEADALGEYDYAVISDGNNIAVYGGNLSQKQSEKLGTVFAKDYFGAATVTDGVMTVDISAGTSYGKY